MGLLVALSMPAHSLWIDTPNVRDGLQFGIFANVNPELTYTSNKFNYVLGNPRIYGRSGTIAQVLADQDRQDSDRRLKADGVHDAAVQFVARQVLTKDLTLRSNAYLTYDKDGHRNHGALWGVALDIDDFGSIAVGDNWTRLSGRQTDANNLIQNSGTHIGIEYTDIPDLTLNAYHMFAVSRNVDDPNSNGWHRSHGISAEYEFDFAPRNKLTVAAGSTRSTGHKDPNRAYFASKGKSYMGGFSYQHNDLTLAADYGKSRNRYNDSWIGTLNTKVYGIKATYEFTPRLTGMLSYARKQDNNSKPIDLQFLIANEFGVENIPAFPVFSRVKQNRYKAGLDYQLYKGVTISSSVELQQTTNYVVEGKFSERDRLYGTLGARFSF